MLRQVGRGEQRGPVTGRCRTTPGCSNWTAMSGPDDTDVQAKRRERTAYVTES
ncbi:hypothetical protein LC1Hm_1349 [Halomicrobium sp. LC1Hm]|nr:hypothetical protein LC1Hm_1349 [Halomicrobium sp. LC1Hm]